MHTRFVVAAFVVLALATACGNAKPQRASAQAGTIVYETTRGCAETFYGLRIDGTGPSRLLSVPSCQDVYWNEKGTKALVLQSSGRGIGPYILDTQSGKKTAVSVTGLNQSINAPTQPWSPDGKRLLLAKGNVEYSRDTDIIFNPRAPDWPAIDTLGAQEPPMWAPDGKAVIFLTTHGIEMTRLSGGRTTLVTFPRHWAVDTLAISGDGKWFSFVRELNDPALYAVRFDGRGLHRVAPGTNASAWSPAGERLAFIGSKGLEVSNLATGRTELVVRLPEAAVQRSFSLDGPPVWSPDGRWILYGHNDLGFGASSFTHLELWAVRSNGQDPHAVSNAFAEGSDAAIGSPIWVAARLPGRPMSLPPLVALPRPLLTTKLPIVALGALRDDIAVGTGFGTQPSRGVQAIPAPRGPIIRLGPDHRITNLRMPGHCVTVSSIVLAGKEFGYVCDNSRFEQARVVFRLGGKELVHAAGGQGIGTFLGGPVTDGRTIAYSVTDVPYPQPPHYKFRFGVTRIYKTRGASIRLVQTVPGFASVVAIDRGRLAVVKSNRHETLSVISVGGGSRDFRSSADYPLGVALDGGRLVTLTDGKLTLTDVATGSKRVLRTALGSDRLQPTLAGASGDLVAYIVGSTIHVMRLSDGREVVLDTRTGTAPVLAQFVANGLYYAYNMAYSASPGRVGFISDSALERAISAHGRQAR